MAHILLIDGNPDNRKALEGLLRYRTQHQFVVVDSQTEGARKAVALKPDVIMISALLFMGKNYAFPRVLQQHEKTSQITFLVYASGRLDEVTQKQIMASGMATIMHLPVSAEELEVGVQEALSHAPKAKARGVAAVVWPSAKRGERQNVVHQTKPNQKRKPAPQSVQWPQVPKAEPPDKAKPHFVSLGDQARSVGNKKHSFSAANYEKVDSKKTKGKQQFTVQKWERVDPKDIKKKH